MLSYSQGEAVMARWPGTKLYYAATVAGLLPDTREYEVLHVAGYSSKSAIVSDLHFTK